MNWKQIEAEWDNDPAFRRSYEAEYPFEAVARSIARLRADHGLTQEELARLADTTQSVIARAESGRRGVNVSLLNRIAQAVGTTWEPVFAVQGIPLQPAAEESIAASPYDWIVQEAFQPAPSAIESTTDFKAGGTTLDARITYLSSVKIIRLGQWTSTDIEPELPKAGNRQSTLALAG